MPTDFFNITRDKTFPSFCGACLVGKREEEMSERDTRYCLGCQVCIEEDYKLTGRKYVIPSVANTESNIEANSNTTTLKSSLENTGGMESPIEKEKEVLLHTKRKELHAYQNPTEDRPNPNVGGRPRKDVPVGLIHKLSDKGLSIGKIVKELKEQGEIISAMTVSRVLLGKRPS